jgi:predicted  nucleic acid-binding Zn-ribbon protein
MQELSSKMDESVRVLRDVFVHEQQEALLIEVAHSLVEKLASRDEEIDKLKDHILHLNSEINSLRARIDKYVRLDGYSSEDLDE